MTCSSLRRDDFELMHAVRNRDGDALAELYDRFSAQVFALCLRLLGDQNDAEELLVDIFWELWEKSGRYNPVRACPRTYILWMARSRAIDRIRSRGGRRRHTAQLGRLHDAHLPEREWSDPTDRIVADEERNNVHQAIRKLDPKARRVLELAYFDGLSHRQIAERIEIPLGTVKTWIRQGIMNLRRALVTAEPSEEEPL